MASWIVNIKIFPSLKFLFKIHFDMESGMGATLNVAKPKKGSTVAIFGLGGVGLAVSEIHF